MFNETDVKLLARIQRNRFLMKICTIFNIWGGHGHRGHQDKVLLGDQKELDEGGPEWPKILWNDLADSHF